MRPYGTRRLGVNVNVDFFAGVIYYLHGIFHLAVEDGCSCRSSRSPASVPRARARLDRGLQVLEQMENNILLRPLLHYVGPLDQPYIPIEER